MIETKIKQKLAKLETKIRTFAKMFAKDTIVLQNATTFLHTFHDSHFKSNLKLFGTAPNL
jgi:hypothetical protein